jgi:hypothetical protein
LAQETVSRLFNKPFRQFSDSPASSPALADDPVVGFANRNRTIMVALGVSLNDHSMNEHHVNYVDNSGFVTAADIGRTAKCCAYLTIEFTMLADRIVESSNN